MRTAYCGCEAGAAVNVNATFVVKASANAATDETCDGFFGLVYRAGVLTLPKSWSVANDM